MTAIDRFEQNRIFVYTRFLAFAAILFLFCGIVTVAVLYPDLRDGTLVSFAELKAAQSAESEGPILFSEQLPGVAIPTLVDKHLGSESNRKALMGWIGSMDVEQQRDFLENMASLIARAESKQ